MSLRWPQGFTSVMAEGTLQALCGAVLGLLCARWWGPELAGVTALAFTLASVFALLAGLGLDQVLMARFADGTPVRRVMALGAGLRMASGLASALGLLWASRSFAETLGPWWLLPLLAFVPGVLACADLWRLRALATQTLHHQVPTRLVVIGVAFVAKTLALVLLPVEPSLWAVYGLGAVEAAVLLGVSIRIGSRFAPAASVPASGRETPTAGGLLAAGLPLLGSALAVLVFFRLDSVALAELASSHALGLYASAMRVVELYMAVGSLALTQLYPQLVRLHAEDEAAYRAGLRHAFGLAYAMAGAIIVLHAVVGAPVITALLGPAYAEAAASSTLFCLLCVPLLSGTVRAFAISIEGLHLHHLWSALLGLALGVPLLWWWVPIGGFRGALAADILTYLASAMLSSWLFRRLWPVARAQWWPSLPWRAGVSR